MRGAAVRPAGVRQGELQTSAAVCLGCALASSQVAASTHILNPAIMAVQVEKQCAKFYTMHVDQDTIDQGFIIAAHSPAVSKFKLLLFEQAPDGHQWELVRQVTACCVSTHTSVCHALGSPSPLLTGPTPTTPQEDSTKMRKVTAAALFFLQLPTATIGSAPSPLETGGDLEQARAPQCDGVLSEAFCARLASFD